MGDMGDIFNAHRDFRKMMRSHFGVNCPQCVIARPKAHPSILLPQQRCRIDGYRDPRAEVTQEQIDRLQETGNA